MASIIYTNVDAQNVYTSYKQNSMALSSSVEKLSTGLQINRASDDPAGLAISENLRGQIAGTNQAISNISNANNFINTADGYLQTVQDMLGRMENLGVEYTDATKSTGDLANISAEFNALQGEISNVFSNAEFNGVQIFNSNATDNFIVDANGAASSVFSLDSNALTEAVNVTNVNSLPTDGTAATQVVAQIQAAIQGVSAQRALLGANQSQLNYKSTALSTYSENVTAAEANIRDVDVAKETTNFSRDQILVQASTSMLAQANSLPQSVLKLLQ